MLYTIGYEGLTLETFVETLNSHAIETLIDVRELPLSRKHGFSKRSLASALQDSNVEYFHERALGAPKPVREKLRVTGNWRGYKEAYLRILLHKDALLKQIANIAQQKRVCLMCFEEDYSTCHRSLVTERMVELNLIPEVEHLNPQTERVAVAASAR